MNYISFIIIVGFFMLLGVILQQPTSKIKIRQKSKNLIQLYSIFTFLGIFAALRSSEVGNDTRNYIEIYQGINSTKYFNEYFIRYEIGYVWLNRICGYISKSSHTIIIVTSIITTVGYFDFFKKYSRSIILSIIMFICLRYFDQTLNIIRECIAICIILYSFNYILKSKFVPFLLCIIAAFLFHKTAIIFLSAWWISKIKFTNRNLYIIFIVSIIFALQFGIIFQNLLSIFNTYSYYDGGQYFGETRLATILMLCIQSIFFYISVAIQRKYTSITTRQDQIMLLLWFVGICILLVSTQFNLLDRIATYFNVFSLVVFPNMITLIRNKNNKRIIIFGTVVILFTYYISILHYRPYWNRIFPYEVSTLITI